MEYKSQIIVALTTRIRKFSLSNLSVLNETVLDLSNSGQLKHFSKGVDLTYNYVNRWRTVIWTDVFDCEGKIVKISSLHWCIYNQHDDHLPVGLSAQLVKHCLGIAEAMGSNPIPARIFFKIYFCYCLIIVRYCKNSSHIHRCFCIVNPGVKLLLFWYLRIRELMHQDVLSL